MAGPAQRRFFEIDLDARAGGDRAPVMKPVAVQRELLGGDEVRIEPHCPAQTPGQWRGDFFDLDLQHVSVPGHGAGSNRQGLRISSDGAARTLGHRPIFGARAIERDIHRAMIHRAGAAAPTRPPIIGREDAADEGDHRHAVALIVADGVEIPPDIAARGDELIERKSAKILAAASRPDRAAIGTPAPGCVLPPAR